MIIVSPLTKGAMKYYKDGMIEGFNCNLAFVDSDFDKENEKSLKKPKKILSKIFWAFSFNLANRIVNQVKKESNHIIIINGEFLPFVMFILILSKIKKIKTSLVWHDVTPHSGSFKNYILWIFSFFNSIMADQLVVHSQKYKKSLSRFYIYKNIKYLPLPYHDYNVSNKQIVLNEEFNFLNDNSWYVFVGNIEPYKGLEDIIDTFINSNINLLIAGTGNKKVMDLLKSKSKSKNLVIKDEFLSSEDFILCIKYAKALMIPYRHASQSNIPYICAELNTPMISTDDTGISEIVKLLGGYLYNRNDEKSLLNILNQDKLTKSFIDVNIYIKEFKELAKEIK